MSLSNKKVKLSKELKSKISFDLFKKNQVKELKKLAEALKGFELKTEKNKKIEKSLEENKFTEKNIKLEKISPVLKPVAETPALENIASSFQLKKEIEKTKKPYEFGEQKYSSQSDEYKTLNKIQSENLQVSTGIEKGIAHMGIEQSTKRKSQKFIDEKSEKEYKNFMYDEFE